MSILCVRLTTKAEVVIVIASGAARPIAVVEDCGLGEKD